MSWWRELLRKATFWRKRDAFADDLETEIRFHLETRAEELAARGLAASEARQQALREFGPRLRVHQDSRAAWQFQWLEDLLSDLSYAARALRRSPAFALTAVLSLALGIGANTTIFSLTMEFLFSNPSCRDGANLRYLLLGGNSHSEVQDYSFLRASGAFEGVAGSNEETEANWKHGTSSERMWAISATDNFFDVVGTPVALGRPIHSGEQNELVLNYGFWKAKLGGNPQIIGRSLALDGELYTVVGILPPAHRTLTGFGLSPDLYKTFRGTPFPMAIYVRLRSGTSEPELFSRARQLATQLDHVYPNRFKRADGLQVRAVSGAARLRSVSMVPFTAFFAMLLVVVGLVLWIACANVSGLLLARAAGRQQELSIRQSLGAGRSRIVRQLLAESLLLTLLGSLAGLLLNLAISQAINSLRLPLPIPLSLHITPDWRLLSYCAILALASALLCGLLPALRATRRDVNQGLKIAERQTGTQPRVQRLLVAGQLAASVLLLTISFLFLENLHSAAVMSPGFDIQHTVWAYMRLVPQNRSSWAQIEPVVRTSLERLRSLPGVSSAATMRIVPLNGNLHNGTDVRVDDGALRQAVSYMSNDVGPDYFRTLGIPLAAGREFLASDTAKTPAVIILNRSLAHRLFGTRNPVGHTLRLPSGELLTVVGVAADSKYFTLGETNIQALYRCYFQSANAIVNLNFMVRSNFPPEAIAEEVRRALASVDPGAALEVKQMRKSMALAMLPSQAAAALLGSMGLLALSLAVVGLYGTLIYAVTRRLREFGLRLALGAARGAIIALVFKESIWILGGGIATGLVLAFLATPPLAAFLVPAVSTHDLLAFSLAIVTLSGAAVSASLPPTLRALHVDPAVSLRQE